MGSRTIAATVVVALALLAAGCGGSDGNSSESAATATTTPAPTETETPTATEDADSDSKDAGDDKDKEAGSAAAKQDCGKVGDIAGSPKTAPPSNLALPGDAHVYESEGPFGKTTRFFAAEAGAPDDLPRVRDDATDALVENGYKLLASDQEKDAEAESHLSGPHTVDIQVISLCKGKVRIRYTVS
jgi:hypothetical protein